MTRKILSYVLLALAATAAVAFILRDRSPFGGRNSSFAVKPGDEITRIQMNDGSHSLSLEKNGDEWTVNERYPARKSSILFITEILRKMEIKSPVTSALFRKEITEKGIEPVKVKIFRRNRLLRSFLVYKTGSNIYGNIMKLRETSKPFIIYVRGNETDIGSAFTLNDLYWQPFVVFNQLPSDIMSVALENIDDPGSSFSIHYDGRSFVLSDSAGISAGWDTSRVERYMTYFSNVPFESWALDMTPAEKEQIEQRKPLYRLRMTMTGGKTTVLTLWARFKAGNGPEDIDTDRLWGRTGDRDELFIIRYMDIDPLLKKRSYFYP